MQLSFGNMIIELKIFIIAKQPHNANKGTIHIDLVEELIDHTFPYNFSMTLYKYI